jgi:hypothetical protein
MELVQVAAGITFITRIFSHPYTLASIDSFLLSSGEIEK